MIIVDSVPFVLFQDLTFASYVLDNILDGFKRVSYGDAIYTMVDSKAILDECESAVSDTLSCYDKECLNELIKEIKSIPNDVLIALYG